MITKRANGACRRKRAQLGKMQALVATAHKIARTVYVMLKKRVQYVDIGAEAYDQKQRERELIYLQHRAARLGFILIEPRPDPTLALTPT